MTSDSSTRKVKESPLGRSAIAAQDMFLNNYAKGRARTNPNSDTGGISALARGRTFQGFAPCAARFGLQALVRTHRRCGRLWQGEMELARSALPAAR